MAVYLLFAILIALISVLLVLIVMVQNPKGGGLNSSFGSSGSGNQLFGVQRTNNFLDKSTWALSIAMMALILLSNFAIQRNAVASSVDRHVEEMTPAPLTNSPEKKTAPITPVKPEKNKPQGGSPLPKRTD